jgi:hypothetical protein
MTKSVNFTPFDTRWVPCSAKFVMLGINPRGTGAFKVFELDHGDFRFALPKSPFSASVALSTNCIVVQQGHCRE